LLGPLVRVWDMINNPIPDGIDTVTRINGKTASPHYFRARLTDTQLTELIEAYRSGVTAKALAERFDLHVSTIKKKLRKHGVRRDRIGANEHH
jgi:DNA-binding NarL/FixJ family response regulator